MIPWETIEAALPAGSGGDEDLSLHRRGDEWSIRTRNVELMNSLRYGSARALAVRAAEALPAGRAQRVAIGGLGMGHTLAQALEVFPEATVEVAEISPRVIAWNRGVLAPQAGNPLADARSRIFAGDVADLLRASAKKRAADRFAAILLDVDNGPEALSQPQNAWLYTQRGIATALDALAPDGVLGVWSAAWVGSFEKRLRGARCRVECHRAATRGDSRGRSSDTVWIASRLPS